MSDLIEQYKDLKPKLERLEANILTTLKQIINKKETPIFAIESRVKENESLINKIARKNYQSPFEEIDDLCGIRIICYYQEDISNICKIIESEFEILKKENKQDDLKDNQFGYSSYHYIIQLKKEWLVYPTARGLDNLRAEVQIRTMLMHTWSAISHKLLYKIKSDVPPQFIRKLNRLSALIELADEQFDAIKNSKAQYHNDLSNSPEGFDSSAELNSDSLIALHKHYFNNRTYSDNDIPSLLDEIRYSDYTLKQLVNSIELCLPVLNNMEKEEADGIEANLPMWNFPGVIRTILDLTSEKYFEARSNSLPHELHDIRNKYRKIIDESQR
ncbi:hypothetical protein D9M69_430700 [compost metagenome]